MRVAVESANLARIRDLDDTPHILDLCDLKFGIQGLYDDMKLL